MAQPCWLTVWTASFFLFPRSVLGGFEDFDYQKAQAVLQQVYGKPCDCRGGQQMPAPGMYITRQVDCGDRIAYQAINRNNVALGQNWYCARKTPVIPLVHGRPGPCPCNVFQASMHSTCYSSAQQCTGKDNKTYFTAILSRVSPGTVGGDWSIQPQVLGNYKLAQAPCFGTVGKPVCWNRSPPVHITDGGGPQDHVRQLEIKQRIEELIEKEYPSLNYHPLALPDSKRDLLVDTQTLDILSATHSLLNDTNPSLAQDCWLCLRQGQPVPLALPALNATYTASSKGCVLMPPLRVQPLFYQNVTCLYKQFKNKSSDLNVGDATFASCKTVVSISTALCPNDDTVFLCGNNEAFTFLPANWTGTCVQASLLPDINIIPGDEPVPIPSFDLVAGRQKRAVQLIPLLVGLGMTASLATGSAGLGVSLHKYHKLSQQLIDDVQLLSSTIQDIQEQLDSLAEMVLQNRRGLDLLTAEQGGICLALQEQCCFYANKSGIVKDKIKKLQEDLEKRRRELAESPFWNGLNGLLPYLLPLLGPLLGLLIILSLGPFLFNKLMAFIKQQIDAIKVQPIQVHYQRLEMASQDYE